MNKKEVKKLSIAWAYLVVNAVVETLKNNGIKITIYKNKDKIKTETIKKYNKPGRISTEYWKHIHFYPNNEEEAEQIFKARQTLGNMGIAFDTGNGRNGIDWEIDWSFHFGNINQNADKIINNLAMMSVINLKKK